MLQNNVHSACGKVGRLGALVLVGAALALAPALEARGGNGGGGHGGGGGSRGGGVSHGGGSRGGGGGTVHGGGGGVSRGGGGISRWGGGSGSTARGGGSSRGWITHSGPRTFSSGSYVSGRNSPRRGGHSGWGYRPGWGGHRYRPIYWGWNDWGWGLGWGWAPYWSTWWWGGPWGGSSYYVAPDSGDDGHVDVGVRGGRYAVVKTDVSPEEAQVYLDGKYIGSADDFDGRPDFLYLGAGKYHLEFKLPNYQVYATDIEVTRGQQVRIDETLKLEADKSALDAFPPESKGTPLGRVFTKAGDSAVAVPRGDDGWSDREAPRAYRDRDRDRDRDRERGRYRDRDRDRDRDHADEGRMDARPEPAPRPFNRARIKFSVTPDDAAVYMDDKYLGAGEDLAANPRGIVAEPGAHTITVTRPGFKTKTLEVTARAGSPVDVVVELEK